MSTEAVVDAIKYIFTKRIQVDGDTLVEDVEQADFTPTDYLVEAIPSDDDPEHPIVLSERIVETGEGKARQRWRCGRWDGMTCSAENPGQLSHPSKDSDSFCIRLDRSLGPSEQSGDTDRAASSGDCGRSYGMGRVTSRPFADPFSLLVPLGDCGRVPLYSNLVAASLGLCSGRF